MPGAQLSWRPLHMVRDEGALAWVDISTGAFRVMPCHGAQLGPELARLDPTRSDCRRRSEAELGYISV